MQSPNFITPAGKLNPSVLTLSQSPLKTYYPLILILSYLLGAVTLVELKYEEINGVRMMTNFMGGFFIVFSFFKFLNLKGFADAYQTYDVVAKVFPIYGWVYPFIELTLGVAYFDSTFFWFIHLATLIVMLLSSIGVAKSLMKKTEIECACLGTLFKLPMTKITLFENLIMVGMAVIGLIFLGT